MSFNPPQSTSPWSILAIDDTPEIHTVYRSILIEREEIALERILENPNLTLASNNHSEQMQLEHAYSGREGVEMVEQAIHNSRPYAVILLDMRMPPGWDGLQTAKQIRAIDPEVRIVLISAHMDHSLQTLREEIGINFEYLGKPFDHDELYQIVLAQAHSWSRFTKLAAMSNQHQQTSRQLRSSAKELDGLRHAINQHAIVSVTDTDGDIIYVNEMMCELSGYSQDELLGENHRILKSEEHPAEFFKEMWETIRSGKSWMGDIKNLKKGSDESYWLRTTITPFSNLEGEIVKYVTIRTDITNMVESKEALESALLSRDNFFASMSHELRTPLTLIQGNCQLALTEPNPAEIPPLLNGIESAAQQQLGLVDDILDMANIESGSFILHEAAFNLRQLMAEIKAAQRPVAEQKELSFTLEQESPFQHALIGDAPRIKKILTNLIDNAIKFTDTGAVSIRYWHDEKHLFINVQDSGIGIAPALMDNLFQLFQQGDSSINRRFGGTGLGLYLAYNLASMMGGEVDASSSEGEGSIFQLRLPYRTAQTIEPVENAPSTAAATQTFTGSVLVAEDTKPMQLMITGLLELMGASTTIANNGKEALALAQDNRYDLILMDMQMPVMDGIEATEKIRDCKIETPIVALTANVMQKHREQFAHAGADGFLSKPIDHELLAATLQKHLKIATQTAEQQEAFSLSPELKQAFLKRLDEQQMALMIAVRQQTWEEVRTIAFDLKGAAPTFGYAELGKISERLCQLLDLQQTHRAPEQSIQLLRVIQKVLSE